MAETSNLKENNSSCYANKIAKKWKENTLYYNFKFLINKEEFEEETANRKNNFLLHRPAVHSYLSKKPIQYFSKGRAFSPDWVYSLVFKKEDEKRQNKAVLRKIVKGATENIEGLGL